MRRLAFAAGMTFATTATLLHRGEWWTALITAGATVALIYLTKETERG